MAVGGECGVEEIRIRRVTFHGDCRGHQRYQESDKTRAWLVMNAESRRDVLFVVAASKREMVEAPIGAT